MQIGRRIYYDKATGNVILDTGERSVGVVETTIEQDFQSYIVLQARVPENVGVIQLEYEQYDQDFAACNGYRVNPSTLQLEFSYPDPSQPEQPPVYRKPLSEEVADLWNAQAETNTTILELMELTLLS